MTVPFGAVIQSKPATILISKKEYMKKYIILPLILILNQAFGQVTIGKTTNSAQPANSSVSLELGNASGGVKGLVLPWATSETLIANASPNPVTGTLFYDSQTKKVKFGKSNIANATAVSEWSDLSLGAFLPNTSVGVADDNTENSSAKVVIATTTAAANNTTNGILVLADDNKAMVLPRVNAYTDIVNPSAGMIVYITSTKQLAVYNGREWSFWTKP